MAWKIASASARGSSHVRSGRPNQDACEHGTGEQGEPLQAVLAVSDGHGGHRHFRSEIGSRLAAHIAVAVIQGSLPEHIAPDSDLTLPDDAVPVLTRKMVDDWRTAVLTDFVQHPFTPEELTTLETSDGADARSSVEEDPVLAYGATLLVVAAARTFMLFLQLGDGDILAVDVSGKTYRPLPGDDRLVGNQTTSLCQPEAWQEFRTAVVRNPQEFAAVVLASTDGYSNSFRSDEDFLKIGSDYLHLVRENGLDTLAEDLPHILSEASEKGSGDDITLSVLVSDTAYAAPPVVKETPVPAEPAVILAAAKVVQKSKAKVIKQSAAKPAVKSPPESKAEPKAEPKAELRAEPKAEPAEVKSSGPRFSASQIRILVLLALLLVGGFLIQYYVQKMRKTEATVSRTPVAVPSPLAAPVKVAPATKQGNQPPEGKQWILNSGGSPIRLQPGSQITSKQLFGAQVVPDDKSPYAEVTEDDQGELRLVNLSEDPWAVVPPGKKTQPPLENGASIVLANGVKITFGHGKVVTIALADVPAPK